MTPNDHNETPPSPDAAPNAAEDTPSQETETETKSGSTGPERTDSGGISAALRNIPWRQALGTWRQDIVHAFHLLVRFAQIPPESVAAIDRNEPMRAFPLIGALIGAIGGAVYFLAAAINLASIACAGLALGAIVVVTRPPHADALGKLIGNLSGDSDDEALRQDPSTLLPYDVIALTLILIIEVGVLAQVGSISWVKLLGLLIVSGAISRAIAVAAWSWSTHDNSTAESASQEESGSRQVIEAIIVAIIIGIICLPADLDALAAGLIAGVLLGLTAAGLCHRETETPSRDTFAAVQQASEFGFLLVAAASLAN